jgi:CNT family concentrative nucleoside transporter
MGLLGIFVFVALGWAFSRDRKAIDWRTVAWALTLQWLFALIVLKGDLLAGVLAFLPFPKGAGWAVAALLAVPMFLDGVGDRIRKQVNWTVFGLVLLGGLRGNLVGAASDTLRLGVVNLMAYTSAGATFVFGSLANPRGPQGLIFAFAVLPTIIFVASIFALLYHLGVMQRLIGASARTISRFLKVSGAESVNVAASILMGQAEAPLTIRPFLALLTRSELMVVMTAGMAHVSGAILVAYVQVAGVDVAHLLTAVVMTAPGAIMMAKLLEPETGRPVTGGNPTVELPCQDANLLDAAARGASEGLQLAFNVAGMLVAFIALVALVNGLLRAAHPALSLERVLGLLFRPFALIMGVPWPETGQVGALLGKRMVVNELVAFIDLGQMRELSAKARLIATFALCGFANFSSIAIQVGGIGALAPERRSDLARLGVKAMLAGSMANAVSGCIAGVLG